jgi:hypothetical protein
LERRGNLLKINEVIRLAGLVEKGNVMEEELAVLWLSELDGMIQSDIMLHSPEEIVSYTSEEDELLLKPPHDKLYIHYLVMMIRQQQQEYEGYQNAQAIVDEKLRTFRRWFVQHYRPADSLSDNGAVSDPGTWGFAYITAYGLAVQQGYRGTLDEWLESLKGEAGEAARMRYDEERETVQWGTGEQWYDLFTLRELRDPAVDAIIAQATAAAEAAAGDAQRAQQSMERAELAAQTANAAAEAAENAAADALGYAEDAEVQATAAATSERNSRSNLQAAEVAAQTAQTAAAAAAAAEGTIRDHAVAAARAAEEARLANVDIDQKVSRAETAEGSARSSAETASTAASSARTHAEQAAQSAQEAKDAADRAGAAGGGGGYIASDEPPEDTRALWIDTSDEPDEAVALGATVEETEEGVKIYATDELGTTMATVRHGRDGTPGATGAKGDPGDPGDPGAPGADGITPHIGDNGNWWIGETDTGKPSRGDPGATPTKGLDYFTPEDVQEIAEQAAGMVEVPGAGGGGGTWTMLTDITLTEDSAIAPIRYDASLYRAMHARLQLPAVVEPIKLVGNFCLLSSYTLYYETIGSTDSVWLVDTRLDVLGNDTMLYKYARKIFGKNSWGNWQAQNDPDGKPARFTCGGSAVFPAGTKLKVWGMT